MNDVMAATTGIDNDFHPMASSASLVPGQLLAATLMGTEVVLWRDGEGVVHAWEDRCPHRGTRLSIGRVENGQVVCAYHGWRFDTQGRCTLVPSQPTQAAPSNACTRVFHVRESYGLVWVCIGDPEGDVLPFPEYDDVALRKVLCGPYDVATSGPRIVENFLDMAHFAYVHTGILGELPHTEVREYDVAPFDDGAGGVGLIATGCFAWQPQTNSLSHTGSDVEYTYRVVRPLTAILTKVPQAQQSFREAISLHVQPVGEEVSRVWIVLAMTNFEQTDADLRAFQDRIFLQDRPILENQSPLRLPLTPRAELPVRADRMSLAYRRYLRDMNFTYGVT